MLGLAMVLPACTTGTPTPTDQPGEVLASPSLSPTSNPTVLSQRFEFKPYPGSRWYAPSGDRIRPRSGTINVIQAPEHCGWQSAAMLHVAFPLGATHREDPVTRQYIRDPKKALPQEPLMALLSLDVRVPKRARFSGYRTDFMELWFDPADREVAYLLFADHSERWPRSRELIACR